MINRQRVLFMLVIASVIGITYIYTRGIYMKQILAIVKAKSDQTPRPQVVLTPSLTEMDKTIKTYVSASKSKEQKSSTDSSNTIKPQTSGPNKVNVYATTSEPENFTKATLRYTKGNMPFYVYGYGDLISSNILRGNQWEGGYVNSMEAWFDRDPALNLIDIGCNLGVYSVVAGKRGRRAVAVDANINNIKRLRKSVLENKIEDKLTIVYNGISDVYREFLVSSPEAGNIGHSLLVTPNKANPSQVLVKSIYMDDLLSVIDFKKAIMKIDIEGHEFEAFHQADKLFTEVNIPVVMMEWAWLGKNKDQNIPKSVKSFFIKFNYKAYTSIDATSPLKMDAHQSWPWDIVWKK